MWRSSWKPSATSARQALIDDNAISHEELDLRRAAQAQSAADVHAAEAAVATAKLNLSFTEVRAPVSGRAAGRW